MAAWCIAHQAAIFISAGCHWLRAFKRSQRVRMRRPWTVKKRCHHCFTHLFNARRMPTWCLVLVHCQRTNAFQGFTLSKPQVKAVPHHAALHAQVIGQRHAAGAADLFEHHMQHQWRTFAQCCCCGACPVALRCLQCRHDGRHSRQCKIMVNFGSGACQFCANSY